MNSPIHTPLENALIIVRCAVCSVPNKVFGTIKCVYMHIYNVGVHVLDKGFYCIHVQYTCTCIYNIVYHRIEAEQERRWLTERGSLMREVQELRVRAEEDMEQQKRQYESRIQVLGTQMVSGGRG